MWDSQELLPSMELFRDRKLNNLYSLQGFRGIIKNIYEIVQISNFTSSSLIAGLANLQISSNR